jgi:hypothetical protein
MCVTCHNQRPRRPTSCWIALDLAKIADARTRGRRSSEVRTGTMPPQPSRRPDHATYEGLIRFLEGELDYAAAAAPNPGRPLLHRLNRAEYANAIHDVLALDVDAASLIPPDDSAYGFDNVSDVLGVSPSLQERYLSAARKISALAVGDSDVAPGSDTFVIRQDLSQNQHIDGMPLGTVGGLLVRHTFPLDGEYTFQVRLYRTNLNIVRGLEYPHQMEFTVDGERIHLAAFGGKTDLAALFEKPTDTGDAVEARLRVRAPIKAGPHVVAVTFVQEPAWRHRAPAGLSAKLRGQLRLVGAAPHADAGDHRALQTRVRATRQAAARFSRAVRRHPRRNPHAPAGFSRRWRGVRIASP